MESCVSKVGPKPHNTLSVNDRAAFVSLERKQLATATIFHAREVQKPKEKPHGARIWVWASVDCCPDRRYPLPQGPGKATCTGERHPTLSVITSRFQSLRISPCSSLLPLLFPQCLFTSLPHRTNTVGSPRSTAVCAGALEI